MKMVRIAKKSYKTAPGLPAPRKCIAYAITHEKEVGDLRSEKGDDELLILHEHLHDPEILRSLWDKWDEEDIVSPVTLDNMMNHMIKMHERILCIGAAYFVILKEKYT